MCQRHGSVIRHHVCTVGGSDELPPPQPAVFPGQVLGGLRLLFTTVIQWLYGRVCDRLTVSRIQLHRLLEVPPSLTDHRQTPTALHPAPITYNRVLYRS